MVMTLTLKNLVFKYQINNTILGEFTSEETGNFLFDRGSVAIKIETTDATTVGLFRGFPADDYDIGRHGTTT